ncbi:MAG TPA: homogentisate 1,2-dioxygenase [Bryobacteraceae bacterium]|jgi:homogentisate 1,2-dioxygenase|nr:homogentisate 1,2-dioxygenase [Bryobacteraceae bacterium]
MPIYHRLGKIPPKRHSVFRQQTGELYAEELIGNKGFVGPSSLLYHVHRPTEALRTRLLAEAPIEPEPDYQFRHRHLRTQKMKFGESPVLNRVPVLFNQDVVLWMSGPDRDDEFFYRNGSGDELIYVTEGKGILATQMGELAFGPGDYLVIPRGIVHRYRLREGPFHFLIIETPSYIRTPKRYRNEHGQLTESAPYSERDIRRPEQLVTQTQKGEFRVVVKKDNRFTELVLAHHPFDVVGWDGYYYPWAFNIRDFEPRVGRFHLPPPTHQTFEADNFVVCSFCPRPYDFDPNAVPAPYNHSNVMSDEVLYYANSEFMSRKGIEYGSITLHPDGIPHGPHPGRTEDSIGKMYTNELAVMIDTFHPLRVTKQALEVEDKDYFKSWT